MKTILDKLILWIKKCLGSLTVQHFIIRKRNLTLPNEIFLICLGCIESLIRQKQLFLIKSTKSVNDKRGSKLNPEIKYMQTTCTCFYFWMFHGHRPEKLEQIITKTIKDVNKSRKQSKFCIPKTIYSHGKYNFKKLLLRISIKSSCIS